MRDILKQNTLELGLERRDGLGWAASFHVDAESRVNCRYLTKGSSDYDLPKGICLAHQSLFYEPEEDDWFVEKTVEYVLPDKGKPFVRVSFDRYDGDGKNTGWETDDLPKGDVTLTKKEQLAWKRIAKRPWDYSSAFDERAFDEVVALIPHLNVANAVEPEDPTVTHDEP